jgi:hypothetical protein
MPNELVVANADVGPETPPAEDGTVPGYVPDGYANVEEFLEYMRKEFDADVAYDRENRDWALEDLKFAAGDQWDETVKAAREAKMRPCLTINVLPQFIGQVIGDRRLNKTAIKVRPIKDATQDVADIRSGIIKGIEMHSRAERVYDAACEDQVTCGISNFRVDMEYAGNDVFDQDLFIRHIPNPLAVIWDRMSVDPTGRDARHCFVNDSIPKEVYDKKFPENPSPSSLGDDAGMVSAGWFDRDMVRITEFWELIDKPATFALMADGDVKDVTGKAIEEYQEELWRDPVSNKPKVRNSFRTYARMHLVTGFAVLSPPYEVPLTRLPIIKVEGRVIRVGDDRVRFGLVRYSKDSQRLKNYWRSVAAETLALAPKAQWSVGEDAIEGREEEWRNAHITGDPLLIHNKNVGEGGRPQRVDPPAVPAALLQEAQMNQQDIKDTTGLHDASLGMRSNEVSGRAINARQREGDVATVIYHDNLNHSIQEAGDILNQLIPICYDTMRTVRVVGPDEKDKLITLNDPNDEDSPDISKGKYDVSLETGPSFTTQRQEAADAMLAIVQTAPGLMEVAGDLIVKSQDWPGAYEISERLKRAMPKELTADPNDPQQPTPEEMAQAEQAQAMQMAQMEEAAAQLEHAAALREAELAEAQAKAAQAASDAKRAKEDAERAEADKMKSLSDAKRAAVEAAAAPALVAQKISLAERAASAKETSQRGAGPQQRPKRQAKGNNQ